MYWIIHDTYKAGTQAMSIFTFIKSRVSIVDIVHEYTTLKKAGNYLKSRCPFHHEKTASFTVSPHKEIYYCFGCHAGGDVISFISKIENCSQIEAAKFLADRYNLEIPDDALGEKHHSDKKHYYDICKAFAKWAHEQLLKHPTPLHYVQSRHISRTAIDQFMLGFIPGGLAAIKQCITALKKESILVDDLLDAQLIAQGKTVLYSPFEDRIIFPIKDHLGRFCGFGGRVYQPQDKRSKYYNSRENEFFLKGTIVFGLDGAKKSIQEQGSVFLVEGYTDCIAMVEHGYPNTVATLGTACSLAHLKLLARYANYVYVLYDSDKAGQEAILRLTHLCWQANMELKVIQLPIGQDPASFLDAGNTLTSRIAQAEDIFDFFIASLGKDFRLTPLAERMERIRTIIEIIRGITDPLKQDILLQSAARTFDIPFETLKRELGSSPMHGDPISTPPVELPQSDGPSLLEKRLFCAIINNIGSLDLENHYYIVDVIATPLKEILRTALTYKIEKGSFDFSKVFDTLSDDQKQYISKLLVEYDEPVNQTYCDQLLAQFQKQYWKRIIRTITTQLHQAQKDGNALAVQKILHDYAMLKEKILQPIAHHQPMKE